MYYTFFFNVDAVVCQNNGQFQVWELNIWQFIVIVEIKYFLNLNEYYLPIFILSIHFRQISCFKITKDIQSNNNNNSVLSMLYAELCPKVRRHTNMICICSKGMWHREKIYVMRRAVKMKQILTQANESNRKERK